MNVYLKAPAVSWAPHCSPVDPGVNSTSFIQKPGNTKKFATVFMKRTVRLWERTGVLVIECLRVTVLRETQAPLVEFTLWPGRGMINNKKANYEGHRG